MWEKELKVALEAASKARDAILQIYETKFDVEIKEDDSPVTLADKTADEIISKYLLKHYPHHALLTEESIDDLRRRNNDYCWIVDPVDGTKDFIAHNDEFTTNIALAYKGEVVVGVVAIPAQNEVYYATKGNGSYHQKNGKTMRIFVNNKVEDLTILFSRFHVNEKELAYFDNHHDKIVHKATYGSAIKACRVAHGLAEITLRLSSGTKEWDTAASQIVVEEAGGVFTKPNGEKITYNREDVYNREGYVITNRPENNFLR